MRIIKDNAIVEDGWVHVPADAALADVPTGDVIVPLKLWQAEKDALLKRTGKTGVRLESDDLAEELAGDLENIPLVAINFPIYRDGRGFSQARILRDRYGYKSELRAVGDVLKDQIFYMHRVGFNAFEVRADRSIEDALKSLHDFSVTYQPAVDDPLPLRRRFGSRPGT
jgi:uncharacterized protein (DUF934 family)